MHNIRIERLWLELGRTIVAKWKPFFKSLEEHGLRVDSAGHIWLLHHLFLDILNDDILEWSEQWNSHVMRLQDSVNASPREMFLFGLTRHPIGLMIQEDDAGDVQQFGIDWEDLEDEELIQALQDRGENPFDDYAPTTMNNVPCEAPECPLSMDQVQGLKMVLNAEFDMDTHNMDVRREIWIRALTLCRELF